MLCSKLLRSEAEGAEHNAFNRWFDARFERFQASYRRLLEKVIDRPLLVGGTALAIAAGCLALATTLSSELAPEEDVGTFFVNVQASEGTGYAQMVSYMEDLQAKVLPLVEEGQIRRLLVRSPASFGPTEDFATGGMTVFLYPWEERNYTTRDVVERVQRIIMADPRVRGNASVGSSLSRGRGRPIQFVIAGSSFDELAKVRDAIFLAAESNPAIIDLDSDYRETRPQILLDIDKTRAGDLGVSVAEIGTTLETMMGSRRVTTFLDRGEEYYVVLQAEDSDRATADNLNNIYVRSQNTGALVPLSSLVTLRERAAAGELGRFNKLRAITLQGNLAEGATLGDALDFLEAEARKHPEVAAIGYRGESLALRQTGSSLVMVLGFTILLVFLVLAAPGGGGWSSGPGGDGRHAQHLFPDRCGDAGGAGGQEWHPDRGVREPVERPGAGVSRGHPRCSGKAAAAGSDDVDRDRGGCGSADAGGWGGCRVKARDRDRDRVGGEPCNAADPARGARFLCLAGAAHQVARGDQPRAGRGPCRFPRGPGSAACGIGPHGFPKGISLRTPFRLWDRPCRRKTSCSKISRASSLP
jgi:hypothetical protein